MRRLLMGTQSASYAAAFPALSEVYSLSTIIGPEEETAVRLAHSSTRSSSGTRGVRRANSSPGPRKDNLFGSQVHAFSLAEYPLNSSPVLILGPGVSEAPPNYNSSGNFRNSTAPSIGSFPFASGWFSWAELPQQEGDNGRSRIPQGHQAAIRSRSTPSIKPTLQMQQNSPPRPSPGKRHKPQVETKTQQESRRSPRVASGALPQLPRPPPPSGDGLAKSASEGAQQQQQQQHKSVGRQQRQQHSFPPAAAIRKAGAGAHYLQHLDALRGGPGGPPVGFGGPRKNGGGLLARPTLPSPTDGSQRLAHPLSSLCLQPLGDGCFRAVPRTHQREGHRQRVAGVDVWRLADGCIVPRIEGAPLSLYLSERAEALAELEAALLSCVQFLYKEGIKPFAGEIAHQLRKRTNAGTWLPSEVVALAMASHHVYPKVERRVKGEDGWVILLKKQLEPEGFEGFVDTRAKENLYTQEQWLHFNKYFIDKLRQGNLSPSCFTEGRYALAERMREEVPAFANTRLAHLIRMIQLASWNRVLTYRDKALIPVAACPAAAKEFIQRHCVDPKGEKAAATAAAIAHLLKVMRRIVNPEPLGIFLAQLKDLVRWTTHERLDAGVYGHPKLQDLLLSDPFSRFYRLYTPEGNDHCTYVQSKQYLLPKGAVIHRKAAVMWRPRDCPMGGSDTPLADSRVWEFKALVPIGGPSDRDAPLFDSWEPQQQQPQNQHQQQQQTAHLWHTPTWRGWRQEKRDNSDAPDSRCFPESQQKQHTNSTSVPGLLRPHTGWGEGDKQGRLVRSKTVEMSSTGPYSLSPPSPDLKMTRKQATAKEKMHQAARTSRTPQQQQHDQHQQGQQGCDAGRTVLSHHDNHHHSHVPQQLPEQPLVLPVLQPPRHVDASGFVESSGEATLRGIEQSLLQLVEESPGKVCAGCTSEVPRADQQSSHYLPFGGLSVSGADAAAAATTEYLNGGGGPHEALGFFPFSSKKTTSPLDGTSQGPFFGDLPTAPETPRAEQTEGKGGGEWTANTTPVNASEAQGSVLQAPQPQTVQAIPEQRGQQPSPPAACSHLPTYHHKQQLLRDSATPNAVARTQPHEDQQQQPQQQQEQQLHDQTQQTSGLQFLWHHPAALFASSVQNTPATDMGFLPFRCDAAAQETS